MPHHLKFTICQTKSKLGEFYLSLTPQYIGERESKRGPDQF